MHAVRQIWNLESEILFSRLLGFAALHLLLAGTYFGLLPFISVNVMKDTLKSRSASHIWATSCIIDAKCESFEVLAAKSSAGSQRLLSQLHKCHLPQAIIHGSSKPVMRPVETASSDDGGIKPAAKKKQLRLHHQLMKVLICGTSCHLLLLTAISSPTTAVVVAMRCGVVMGRRQH